MGFIERISEAMKPTPTPEQTEQVTKKTDAEKQTEQTTGTETEDGADALDEATPSEEKTYSQDEIEAIIEERKKEWETERMNALSKDGQIEQLKAELLRRDLKEKVTARLEEVKLPLGVAEFVQYTDEVETMANLEKVIATVNQLVQDGVMMRLRGKTPEGLGAAAYNENQLSDPFAKAFIDAMKK